ncbi:MAG: CDP-diacylglycerol--glycerol-3-phosphate 3-phosphatidyltransferase [Candidatus Izemoplasma sp.]|nr:CDP-diacylglycerol--glycerol-3-phosphate 3-phosphatidyltransferase [Candidatus Izemoplasma sp.]
MNLPNKLSMFRIILVPVLLVVYYLAYVFEHTIWTTFYLLGPIFVLASITDFFDGYIARKYQLVTSFGKFIDPLADKLIVLAALLILNDLAMVPIWVTALILSREFIVTGIRLVAAKDGTVIAASNLGKYKTATTMVAIVLLLFSFYIPTLEMVGVILIYAGTLLTLISGIDYFIKNKDILLESI